VATEDLAYLLRSMGLDTGIDLPALLALRAQVAGWLAGESLHGTIAQAGLPRTLTPAAALPLAGLRVVEFTHMVMGPTCGMVLADLGAEVIKVEPVEGDRTRHLLGAGAGFFPMFNRNKKSIALDLRNPEGWRWPASWPRRRRGGAKLQARRDDQVRAGLRRAVADQPPPHLREPHRAFWPGRTSTAPRWTKWCR
jgi:hypothetical protein